MANVIIRFSVYSEEEGIEIEGIKEILKNADEFHLKGDEIFLTDGKPSGQIFRETSFMYTSKMMSINNIGICNSKWMREWRDNVTVLAHSGKLSGYKLHLNYEISVSNNDFPELYFQPDFFLF